MLWYLATPYTHEREDVQQARYEIARDLVVKLSSQNHKVISPVVYGHNIDSEIKKVMVDSYTFWLHWSDLLLQHCDGMIVAMMPGWQESKGVQHEIHRAVEFNKRIDYLIVNQEEEDLWQSDILALKQLVGHWKLLQSGPSSRTLQ